MSDKPILQISDLDKYFGGLHAVNEVSFKVQEGIIKAVIGPNGAGKTTLFNMIAGYFPPTSGKIFFRGEELTGSKPFQTAQKGLFRTFQNLKVCRHMSVLDNVLLGRHTCAKSGFLTSMFASPKSRREEADAVEKIMPLLEWVDLAEKKDVEVGNLSFGQQRAVELARVLASDPSMILLDEPAAGLNMHETNDLAEKIQKIKEQGKTILLVEHDMGLVMDISDEIVVLNFGGKVAEGKPLEVQKNEDVIRIYLGGNDA